MGRELTPTEEQAITLLRPVFESLDRLQSEIEALHTATMAVTDSLIDTLTAAAGEERANTRE